MRVFLFLLALAAASALAGWWLGAGAWPIGALAVSVGMLVVEHRRARQLAATLQVESRTLADREQALRETEARLDEFLVALQDSPDGVVLLDEKGRIEWCNETAARHFGFDIARDRQQAIGNLVRDPAFAAYLASWNYSRDLVLTMPAGASMPAKLSVQAHAYAGNRRLLLSRDITAVEQAEAMRRDFVANVSHEIRTPLTVLTGFVETLQTLPLEEAEKARYLDMMAQQAGRMQTLVKDLLTLSTLEGSPPPGAGEWTPVATLLAQCAEEARSLSALVAPASPHEVVIEPAPELEIAGSAAELLSAMSNLAGNAIRYTPPGGRVNIAWHTLPDARAEFSVRDTGPGIAPEHLPRLTERFYRVDRSRSRETGGTGLGLAIVKHVVQRHGAELKVESTPGVGSTFSIVFPASRLRAVVSPDRNARPATADPQEAHYTR